MSGLWFTELGLRSYMLIVSILRYCLCMYELSLSPSGSSRICCGGTWAMTP